MVAGILSLQALQYLMDDHVLSAEPYIGVRRSQDISMEKFPHDGSCIGIILESNAFSQRSSKSLPSFSVDRSLTSDGSDWL